MTRLWELITRAYTIGRMRSDPKQEEVEIKILAAEFGIPEPDDDNTRWLWGYPTKTLDNQGEP